MKVLERLKEFMGSYRDSTVALNAPASNVQLSAAEDVMGVKLPKEVREAYACFNGVVRDEPVDRPPDRPRGPALFVPLYDWVDLDRMVEQWQKMRRLEAEFKASGTWPDVSDSDMTPGQRVRPVQWHPKWIPIGSCGAFDKVCIDMAPTRSGVRGQLVYSGLPEGPTVVADGLFSYLERLFNALDGGKLSVDSDGTWRTAAGAMATRLEDAGA